MMDDATSIFIVFVFNSKQVIYLFLYQMRNKSWFSIKLFVVYVGFIKKWKKSVFALLKSVERFYYDLWCGDFCALWLLVIIIFCTS